MATRVMLVDDDDALRRLLRLRVELSGFTVVAEATDALAAPAIAARARPDVVVSDLRLLAGDGIGLVRRLRQEHPAARLIVFTGWADPLSHQRARAAGADDVVLKSGSLNDLVRSMGEVGSICA